MQVKQVHSHPLGLITNKTNVTKSQPSFKEVLGDVQNQSLKISKHAQLRIQEREINISINEWNLIEEKIQEARHKGVTDSLIILQDAALIVSASNKTVVTAMNKEEAKSQIFTNINGTIIMD
ncbi:TIGR02530 family flagellar biosynthesis protein [Metabacillus halosaccharovorans]|uniref:TIGR02530 family flagellar biosynthesis protein n=1 Tax=Metabacillus halosaccharovorans TaxID=930124 RepID=UPI000994F3F7